MATADPDAARFPSACKQAPCQWSPWAARLSQHQRARPVGATQGTAVSRSAEKGGRGGQEWLSARLPAAGQTLPPPPGPPGCGPYPIVPPNSLLWDTRPGQVSIWGFLLQATSKASRSWLSWQQGLSGGSLSWAAACAWMQDMEHLKSTARPALPTRSPSLHLTSGAGRMKGSRLHHLPPLASGPPTQAASVLAACLI